MTTTHIDHEPIVEEAVRVCFPNYRGRKFRVSTTIPKSLDSYWDGGSRTYYAFFQPSTGKAVGVHSNHPVFEKTQPRELPSLPEDILLVAHSIFCGKDLGITVYCNPSALPKMLPAPTILADERIVLEYTATLVNTYQGIGNFRFREAKRKLGITAAHWEGAKAALIAAGHLTKAGAITTKGRNAIAI